MHYPKLTKRLAFGTAFALALSAPGLAPPSVAAAAPGDDWPTYQHTADRAGHAAAGSTFSGVQPGWTSAGLDGAVYAEPLYVGGHVLVATENNTVYSIDASSGAVVWQTHLADPVAAASLPCGNIRPTVGITGTPVVDTNTGVLYAAAMVQPTSYTLYALDLGSGSVVLQHPLDQPLADEPSEGQRGALALDMGRVYIPFGGRNGDCGSYHGQIIGASEVDPNAALLAYTTPAKRAGIWAPGGVAIADDGTLYAATGNGDATGPEGRTEAVVGLTPMLEELDTWQPTDWLALDKSDADVGSVPPALLQDLGLVFQSGKNGKGYLLHLGALGGVGGEITSSGVPSNCGGVFGATAYAPPLLYIPCGSAVVSVRVTNNPPAYTLGWRGPDETGQPTVGSPIVVAGAVWDIDLSGKLFALDAGSGTTLYQTQLGGQPSHFAALSYGGGQIYTASVSGVAAYQLTGLITPN